jgi:hypothetical protein
MAKVERLADPHRGLELSRNQVTHFYSCAKNTDEMIKMADLLQ